MPNCYEKNNNTNSIMEIIQGAELFIPFDITNLKNKDSVYCLVFIGYFTEDPLNIFRLGGI